MKCLKTINLLHISSTMCYVDITRNWIKIENNLYYEFGSLLRPNIYINIYLYYIHDNLINSEFLDGSELCSIEINSVHPLVYCVLLPPVDIRRPTANDGVKFFKTLYLNF